MIYVILGTILLVLGIIIAKKIINARIHHKCECCGDDIRYKGICQDCIDLIDQDTCDNQGD